MPKPTAHIIDRFHIAMKIQPMQQIAGHLSRSNSDRAGELPSIHGDVSTLKWRLRHARVDRVVRGLERLLARLKNTQREGEFSIARLHRLALQLLTYVRSNNYGKRYRAGLRVATTLAGRR